MIKILLLVASILTSFTVAALAWTTVPALQKQVDELQEQVDELQESDIQPLYNHSFKIEKDNISVTGTTVNFVGLFDFVDENEEITPQKIYENIENGYIYWLTNTNTLNNFTTNGQVVLMYHQGEVKIISISTSVRVVITADDIQVIK